MTGWQVEDDNARAAIEKHMPDFVQQARMAPELGVTLSQMVGFGPDQLTNETLRAIAGDLRAAAAEEN